MVWPQIWLRDCRHNIPASSEVRSVIWQFNLKITMFDATYNYIYVLWQRFRRQSAGGQASWATYVDGRGHHLQAISPRRIEPPYARTSHVELRMMSGILFGWRYWRARF